MRWLVIVVALGCSSKSEPRVGSASGSAEPPAPPATGPGMRALPKPVPPGPYVVSYHCDLDETHYIEQAVDLGARTVTSFDSQPPPIVKSLDDAAMKQLQGAVDKLVRGGPYRAEPPDPEGTACYLAIGTSPNATFFQIDKSLTNEADAVSELVALIHRTANRGG